MSWMSIDSQSRKGARLRQSVVLPERDVLFYEAKHRRSYARGLKRMFDGPSTKLLKRGNFQYNNLFVCLLKRGKVAIIHEYSNR